MQGLAQVECHQPQPLICDCLAADGDLYRGVEGALLNHAHAQPCQCQQHEEEVAYEELQAWATLQFLHPQTDERVTITCT